jgi:hypothetical protein
MPLLQYYEKIRLFLKRTSNLDVRTFKFAACSKILVFD